MNNKSFKNTLETIMECNIYDWKFGWNNDTSEMFAVIAKCLHLVTSNQND